MPPYDSLIQTSIAAAQARAGDVKQALRTVEEHRAKLGLRRNHPLGTIARIQAERGEEKEALAWARQLTPSGGRGYALLGVAQGLVQRHKLGAGSP